MTAHFPVLWKITVLLDLILYLKGRMERMNGGSTSEKEKNEFKKGMTPVEYQYGLYH